MNTNSIVHKFSLGKKLVFLILAFQLESNICGLGYDIASGAILVDPPKIDIGTHKLSENVKVSFKLFNQGRRSITIKNIISSCGCVHINTSSNEIVPNGYVDIEVVINGLPDEAELNKLIWIVTNNRSNPVIRVPIHGKFLADNHQLRAFPHMVVGGISKVGERTDRVIAIERNGGVPIGDIRITPSQKWIKVYTEKREGERQLFLHAIITSQESVGKYSESILIEGPDPNDSLQIPVSGETLPTICIYPKSILVSPEQQAYKIHVVKNASTKIALLCSEFKGVDFKLLAIENHIVDKSCLIVRLKRNTLRRYIKGELLLKFTGIDKPYKVTFVSAT